MADNSPRMLWPFPEQFEEPFWDTFVDFIRALDASGFAAREDRNIILGGGGQLTWNVGAGLTWSEDFVFLSPSTGYYNRVTAATLVPNDGQIIKFDVTRHPGQNVTAAAAVANIAENTDDSYILGIRIGTNFIFRNGFWIKNGTIIDAEDLFSGSGGGGSNLEVQDEGVTLTASASLMDFVGEGVEATMPVANEIEINIPRNFSFKTVPVGEQVTIPTNQQMIVSGGITIDGSLVIDGELALIP